jgi:hypothetical protein
MSEVDGEGKATDLRRHPRLPVEGDFRATVTDAAGVKTDVHIRDISASGAGLIVDGAFENDSFVELHMERFGKVQGRVARKFIEGIGMEFNLDEADKDRFKKELIAFRKAGGGQLA